MVSSVSCYGSTIYIDSQDRLESRLREPLVQPPLRQRTGSKQAAGQRLLEKYQIELRVRRCPSRSPSFVEAIGLYKAPTPILLVQYCGAHHRWT